MKRTIDDLFSKDPRPRQLSIEELSALKQFLWDNRHRVPLIDLDRKRKQKLSGHMHPWGILIVTLVADGLRRGQRYFPDVPITPEELEAGMARADLWLLIHDRLRSMAEMAHDHFVLEETAVIRNGMDILAHVRADAHRRFRGEHERERESYMHHAQQMLDLWYSVCAGAPPPKPPRHG